MASQDVRQRCLENSVKQVSLHKRRNDDDKVRDDDHDEVRNKLPPYSGDVRGGLVRATARHHNDRECNA